MWNSTLAPGTKPVYQSADKKWVQSTCLEFTWQCSQVLWLQAGPTISSELHNRTIAGFSVTGWKWNTCKCPDVKYTSGSVSWTVCASGHLFLVRFVGSTRPEFIFMQRIPTRAHTALQSSTVGTFKAGICDGAEITIEARRPACRFPISSHVARRMLSTVGGWGGCRAPSCPLNHVLQNVLAEP